jgi:hypothetical protein
VRTLGSDFHPQPPCPPFHSADASYSKPARSDLPNWLLCSSLLSCSSSCSDGSPLHEVVGKGKAPAVAEVRPRAARRPHPRLPFMEAARRPSSFLTGGHRSRVDRPISTQPRSSFDESSRHVPVLKSVLTPEARTGLQFTAPDSDGWQRVVRKRKCKPLVSKHQSSS